MPLTTYILFINNSLHSFFFLFLLLSLRYHLHTPSTPFRFVNRGAGEFLLAVHLAYVIPSITFTLQADETHRFLALGIPLMFLAFSYFIVRNFQSFAQDQKYNRVTFLTRLGWERVTPCIISLCLVRYLLLSCRRSLAYRFR
ncbi:MAG: hypothetical protein U0V48_12310 [Anaerolineales bacterium]